ncbi:MAG TPA: c-type cytochrome [Terriglobia bacterium]|nr:c-type cytochrome [Terriglobia bacterium]
MNSWKRRVGVLGLVSFTGIMLSCTANKRPSKMETLLANVAKDVAIPIQATDRKNPFPATPESIERGRRVYQQSCALCHGPDGRSATQLGRDMYPPAMDLNSPHVQHWSDGDLFWIVKNGIRLTGMPAWDGSISDDDTWKLARFIHALPQMKMASNASPQPHPTAKKADLIRYGQILYRQEGCFTCHRLDGEGTKVGPDLTDERKRGRTDQWLIGHFKNPTAYSPGSIMPSFKNLQDEQLQALVAFLQNQKGSKK